MNAQRLYQLGMVRQCSPGLNRSLLASWLDDPEMPVIEGEEMGGRIRSTGPGQVRMFAVDTILQIAIASRLWRLGVPARESLLAGMKVAGFGEMATGKPHRPAGELFPTGETFLVVAPGGVARVVNASPAGGSVALWHVLGEAGVDITAAFGRGETALALLDVGAVYREVMQKLGLAEPEAVE